MEMTSSITSKQSPSTFPIAASLAGLIIAASLPAAGNNRIESNIRLSFFPHSYAAASNSATYDSTGNALTEVYSTPAPLNFEQAISDFYTQLLAKQEPLDENFEKLLHKNLWNLYEV